MGRRLLTLLILTFALSACGDPPGEVGGLATSRSGPRGEAIHEWDAPPNYAFRVRSSCGEQNFIGTFRIIVENGEVLKAKGLDDASESAVRYMGDEIPTLSDLLGYALEAQSSDADVVQLDYDESDGHPTRIEIDHRTNAIDDESCFVISDYEAE